MQTELFFYKNMKGFFGCAYRNLAIRERDQDYFMLPGRVRTTMST